jgi:acetylornithine deacetylase
LNELEQAVAQEVARREDELVELLRALIRFDTRTHAHDEPAREERDLQEHLASRLRAAGAEVSVFEPDSQLVAGHPFAPEGFTFAGRPQLVARFAGRGRGRSLLFNGHVDVVDVEPRAEWTHDPFAGEVADGRVYGRGACDMKGGIAAMVLAAEVLASLDVPLAGDLIINTVTDEESTGAGGLVSARTLQPAAAIVTEPTALEVAIACRGSLLPTISIEGRSGHAGIPPRPPEEGGPVNAIEKAALVLDAVARLRERWETLEPHPYLAPADCLPTRISGGEWLVSYPARCRVDCHIEYLPTQADADGWGSEVERAFERWIAEAAVEDSWLRDHPPVVEWLVGGVPPAEVPADSPVVQTALASLAEVGRESRLAGFQNWHDGATLTVDGGIPAVALGPGDVHLAHSVDEHVPVDELVACAQALALTAMRFCGAAD